MSDKNLTAITSALFAPATQEDYPDNASIDDFVDVNPDDYDEDFENEEDYESWEDRTYYAGYESDEYTQIEELYIKLNNIVNIIDTGMSYMRNEDYRYEPNEFNALQDAIHNLTGSINIDTVIEKARSFEHHAADYSTY